jgi:hypothetical protein
MAPEVQTRSGRCETHGMVEATREVPRLEFPYMVWAVRLWLAKRRPFSCPVCEAPGPDELNHALRLPQSPSSVARSRAESSVSSS